ncbi:e73bd4e0-d5a4-416e-b710-17ca22d07e43 [Thermothielavioides terrestris]|nr:e73bd4e0-d5a4-416e-b710-17ca22d07e43 [Thermothielavioides terrestris]
MSAEPAAYTKANMHDSPKKRRARPPAHGPIHGDSADTRSNAGKQHASADTKLLTRQDPNTPQDSPSHPMTTSETPAPPDQRRKQNRVGKRYRDKLGAEFESLQAALHVRCSSHDDLATEVQEQEQGDKNTGGEQNAPSPGQPSKACGSRSRGVNKAKILELARQRVGVLLQERETVMAERNRLLLEKALGGW